MKTYRYLVADFLSRGVRTAGEVRDRTRTVLDAMKRTGRSAHEVIMMGGYSVRTPDRPKGQPRCNDKQPTGGQYAPQGCGGRGHQTRERVKQNGRYVPEPRKKARAVAPNPEKDSLSQFIRHLGGLKDDERGSYAGELKRFGGRKIVRIDGNGVSVDRALQEARNGGYLPDDATEADLLELLENDLRGDRAWSINKDHGEVYEGPEEWEKPHDWVDEPADDEEIPFQKRHPKGTKEGGQFAPEQGGEPKPIRRKDAPGQSLMDFDAPKKEESGYGVSIEFRETGSVSDEFRSNARTATARIPPKIMKKAGEAGVSFEFGDRMANMAPDLAGVRPRGWPPGKTWDSTDGCFRPAFGTVMAAETHKGWGDEYVKSGRTEYVVSHEFGHAFDTFVWASGVKGSNRLDWMEAHREDVRTMGASLRQRMTYFTQSGEAGRCEAFAEAFAGNIGADIGEDFAKAFPRCVKQMEGIVKGAS